MESKFKGKLIELKPQETKGKFTFQEAIFKETKDDYPSTYSIKLVGKTLGTLNNSHIGNVFEVCVNIKSNEYNGRYYTDLQAWKLTNDIPF